tara:strand:- start:44 stop:631 length:588 start_codon:yes stop_codon:yes gene_type:complete
MHVSLFLLFSTFALPALAHEPKDFTVLLKEDSTDPPNIPSGILVETDSLFFINVDDRPDVSHRIQFDSDGDGKFGGADDLQTSWLNESCEIDDQGARVDPSCRVNEAVLLGPQNGLLPGNLSLRHQIKSNSTIEEVDFYVVFEQDSHEDKELDITQPSSISELPDSRDETLLVVILFISLMGIMALLPSIYSDDS